MRGGTDTTEEETGAELETCTEEDVGSGTEDVVVEDGLSVGETRGWA